MKKTKDCIMLLYSAYTGPTAPFQSTSHFIEEAQMMVGSKLQPFHARGRVLKVEWHTHQIKDESDVGLCTKLGRSQRRHRWFPGAPKVGQRRRDLRDTQRQTANKNVSVKRRRSGRVKRRHQQQGRTAKRLCDHRTERLRARQDNNKLAPCLI